MPDLETPATSSSKDAMVLAPWWVHLCRWLWKIAAFLGVSVVLSLAVSVLSFWLTSPGGVIPARSPAARLVAWLVARWPVMLLVGCCFLLLALLIGVVSRGPAQATLPLAPAQQNRMRMLRRLRRSYSDVLAQSLQGTAWMELGLAHQPAAVQNATTLLLRLAHRTEQLLPPGTSLTQVYEEAAHELLILGEPGAGKSTLLLQLAQKLVKRAEQDDTQPLPVLLPLSSWAEGRPPLEDYIRDQVAEIYDIPRQLAQRWVQDEQVLPLLDGLDEMEELARPICIAAINAYHHTHGGPLVVCSRKAEYEEAAKHHRLILQNAVVVQSLSHEQVDAYLLQAGKPLAALRGAIKKNPALQELATTPLMLSVLMLAYHGTSRREYAKKEAALYQQVWTDYVQRMVERKGNAGRYPLERTCSWLHWLARQMRIHNQTVFYLEHLQPDWLPIKLQRAYTWLAVLFPSILIGALVGLIVPFFLNWTTGVPSWVLQDCMLGGFLGGLFSASAINGASFQRMRSSPRGNGHLIVRYLVISILLGLSYGLSFGLNLNPKGYGPTDWLRDGEIWGTYIALSCFLLMYLVPSWVSQQSQTVFRRPISGWQSFLRLIRTLYVRRALLVTVVFGGAMGLSYGLYLIKVGGREIPEVMLRVGLYDGLTFGLISVLISFLLKSQDGSIQLVERLRWSWNSLLRSLLIPAHIRTTILYVSIIALIVGLAEGVFSVLNFGLGIGLIGGLGYGLGGGLSFGLVYWLLLGLSQGIAGERVEDRDRRMPNQGLQGSSHNGLLMGMISGVLFGLMIAIDHGLRYGLSSWWVELIRGRLDMLSITLSRALNEGLSYGLHHGLLVAGGGALLVCAISGGLAVLRHAVLRLLLWRTHTFPWQAISFLEDARARIFLRRVGGGYSFMHRLLLDHFADLEPAASSPPATHPAEKKLM